MALRPSNRRSLGGHEDMRNSSMSHIPEEIPVDVGFRRSVGPSIRFPRPQDMHRSPPQLYRKNSNANTSDPNVPMSVVDPTEDGATEPCGKDKYAKVRCLLACLLLSVPQGCAFGPTEWDLTLHLAHTLPLSCLLEDSTCFRLSPDGTSRTHATSHQTIYLAEFTTKVWEFQINVAIE
jgi:hypothetical protein